MHAIKELFTSDVGLMSIAGIAFMLGTALFYVRYLISHVRADAARADAERALAAGRAGRPLKQMWLRHFA
jgi:hypothetical protein